jgi:hypothetical protein
MVGPPKRTLQTRRTQQRQSRMVIESRWDGISWQRLLDDDTRKKLIDALDPNLKGYSRWRLKFKHGRGGHPNSKLGAEIREVITKLVKDEVLKDAKRHALIAGTKRPSWSDDPTYSTFPIWRKIARVLKLEFGLQVGKSTIKAAKARSRPPRRSRP